MNMFWELLEVITKFTLLNFDPVKEILKIRYKIDILMKNVIILRKIRVKMKSIARSAIERN